MTVKSIFSGSAILFMALLSVSLFLSARPLSAETRSAQTQGQTRETAVISSPKIPESHEAPAVELNQEEFVVAATNYVATAYSLKGRTASGRPVSKGMIAADPRFLPLGSRVRLEAGSYSGEYLVTDTGGAVRGRHVDIWTPTAREAMKFGRRTIKLTILSFGGRRRSTAKSENK
ncbi:MAG: 3D domain-containing protein [Pyrinomonadaceae bacterium]